VHLQAAAAVVEDHAGHDLLAEVLHEAVGAEVQSLADLVAPPRAGRRIGEVDERRGAAERVAEEIRRPVGGPRHDAAAQRVLEDARGLRPGHVVGHERAEVEEDAQAAAVQPRDEVAQDRAREDPPALEPVGAQRDAVAREVTQVLTHLGLVAGRRLASAVARSSVGPMAQPGGTRWRPVIAVSAAIARRAGPGATT
jgi:hypothetical protein